MEDNEVVVHFPLKDLRKVLQILEICEENTQELLSIHLQSLGEYTKKNIAIADMYRIEINEVRAMREYIKTKFWVNCDE